MCNAYRSCRGLACMSRASAAEALGVTKQTLANWETGKSFPKARSIEAMADLYGVSCDQLLGRKPLVAKD